MPSSPPAAPALRVGRDHAHEALPYAHRPGIAVTIPAFHGPVVLIDAGSPRAQGLAPLQQYGLMAETFAKVVLGIPIPASPR